MFDTEQIHHAEYIYKRGLGGRARLARGCVLALYPLFAIAFFAFCYLTRIIPLFALCPVLLWILVYFTWPRVSYDYYVTFASGQMCFGRVYRGKDRREVLSLRLREATAVFRAEDAPYTEEKGIPVYDFSGSKSQRDTVVIQAERAGGKCTVRFCSTPQIDGLICLFFPEAKLRAR